MKRPKTESGNLDAMLARVLQRSARGNIDLQRGSFAIGSAALEESFLTRSSIAALAANPNFQNSAEIEVGNLVALYDFVISVTQDLVSSGRRLDVSPDLIKELHRIGLSRLTPEAGKFRQVAVAVAGSGHRSPNASELGSLVEDACKYINRNWDNASAVHLAAYALWRVLWIHPFADGNGRVARSLSYLILGAKSGAVLPGTPTLPALIAQNREAYYSALEAADGAARRGEINLSEVEHLISNLLKLQLTNSALLPDSSGIQLQAAIESRVLRSSADEKRRLFDSADPKYRLWSHGSYLVLQVGGIDDIEAAVRRHDEFGEPFPGLLSLDEAGASLKFAMNQTAQVLQGVSLSSREVGHIYLSPDVGLILAGIRCQIESYNYLVSGVLYCLRLGPYTTEETCSEFFDLLIARDIRVRG